MWHEALEEASRLYFGEHNIEGMLKVLEPLHEMLEDGAVKNNTTIKERAFIEVVSLFFLLSVLPMKCLVVVLLKVFIQKILTLILPFRLYPCSK